MQTIEILNPMPGGSWYTSIKKAHEFVRSGRAVIEDGTLRFVDRVSRPARIVSTDDVVLWNGHPKPKIMQKVSIRSVMQDDIMRGAPMHRPGEVRS